MKYASLTELYNRLESTTKRLEKTYHVAALLEKTSAEELPVILTLVEGRIFPRYDERKIGMASKLVLKAINVSTGISAPDIEAEWKDTGDLGLAAKNLIARKSQSTLFSADLSVKKVYDNMRKLPELTGAGSVENKIKLLAELLTSAKPDEAKYIIRTVLEDMRIGVGEGSLRDAMVWAFFPKVLGVFRRCSSCGRMVPATPKCIGCGEKMDRKNQPEPEGSVLEIGKAEDLEGKRLQEHDCIAAPDVKTAREAYNWLVNVMQEAIDMKNDFGAVAVIAKEKGLEGLQKVELSVGEPIKVMLYPKAADFEDAFERVGRPAAFEYKIDGFRIQIHRKGDSIRLYTRRLEDVTEQFPDIVSCIKDNTDAKGYILDSEVIGIDPKTKKYLPFQNISMRIKRKHGISDMSKKIPVMVNVFDVMELEGKNMLKTAFAERRKKIEKIVNKVPEKLQVIKQIMTDDIQKARRFYEESLAKGNEGVMAKSLKGIYKPGSRVGYGVKIKPVMETLDLVIVGATWGEGKRSAWLSSFTLACIDENGEPAEIGKVGTGIKEKAEQGVSFDQLTELLKPLIISEKGREVKVKPKIVVEVNYEEIQRSPNYGSGFALRFPRVIRLRLDRGPDDASDISYIEDLYHGQRGKK
ncbi:ATP-dependent DNA ligase [Candidatus Woesearchaeota archaeon]|nr:ATP-dependent DNA ligase [Candidatus Woesearchaeota archaeon]